MTPFPRCFFFDIDWTLFDHQKKEFPLSMVETLKKFQKLHPEIPFFLCTARDYDSFKRLGTLDLGIRFDGYVASAGGVVFAKGKYLKKTLILPSVVRKLLNYCEENKISVEGIGPLERYTLTANNDSRKRFYEIYFQAEPPRETYNGQELIGLNLFCREEEDDRLERYNPDLKFSRFFEDGVDCSSVPHEKGPGLSLILEEYGLKKEDAIGFGDDLQDLSLASHVGNFVCMGNGKPELKRKAAYIAPNVYDDGIARAFYALGLL